jgi:hypothetical protein
VTRTIASSFLGAAIALVFVGLLGFTPDARNNGVLPTGSVSLAEMADLATDKLLGRVTAGTGVPEAVTFTDAAQSLVDDATVADMRTTLGLGSLSVIHQYYVVTADQTESAASYTDATGLSITPDANSSYWCEAFLTVATSAATTAFQWKFVGPTGTDHTASYLTQPTTSTATGFVGGAVGTGNEQSAIAATTGTPIYGWALIRTGATPSGDLKIQFKAEIAGGQSVTLKRGSFMQCFKQE